MSLETDTVLKRRPFVGQHKRSLYPDKTRCPFGRPGAESGRMPMQHSQNARRCRLGRYRLTAIARVDYAVLEHGSHKKRPATKLIELFVEELEQGRHDQRTN